MNITEIIDTLNPLEIDRIKKYSVKVQDQMKDDIDCSFSYSDSLKFINIKYLELSERNFNDLIKSCRRNWIYIQDFNPSKDTSFKLNGTLFIKNDKKY